ncbi:2Fe-2S iron-sulfur cluster-binding protein [Endozoicomonas arenosclerae]|uniref:2Fe-2S iron-sulfur cluster-binding protein n=1 Tax=Endozoicomonas arenosclerae TaxID=1633495 RepID=UPI00078296A4|nr:2Fe-2S iron-sulfur cluster-binding protein [Endozoicomonas arenosclerae]
MPVITLSNRSYPVNKDKRLLDSLLENGEKIPFSCRSGICHACLLKADRGQPPVNSQTHLSRERVREGYFLACQCLPEQDMTVSLPTREHTQAIITAKHLISPTVVSLELAARHPMDYFPGQHVRIDTGLELTKECYLASVPSQDRSMVIHVQRKVADPFSIWAHDSTAVGQKVSISSPRGLNLCGNLLDTPDQILIAQEGSLAPLLAYARSRVHATSNPQALKIHLFQEASSSHDHYCLDLLTALAESDHFDFTLTTGRQDYTSWLEKQINSTSPVRVICAGDTQFSNPIHHYCSKKTHIECIVLSAEFS